MLSHKPVDILVVEDNESERDSIVDALQTSVEEVQVFAVHTGGDALDFLLARGPWASRAGAEGPRLILLDLELARADGFYVLDQIRAFEAGEGKALVPVVIFSDSQADGDIARSYRSGANSYIIKPLGFLDFQAVVKAVGNYWIVHNRTCC